MQSFVDQMISLQFNAFRIPVVAETLTSSSSVDGYATPLDELNAFLTYTQSKGVYVLLDLHKCSKDQSPTDKPGPGVGSCSGYTESAWTADLTALATLAKKYSNVVGIDLFNEPYGLTWARWSAMAERAGQAVLQTNPKLLIFVEGVGNDSTAGHDSAFWGENLFEASTVVPNLPRERLIYSPHIYGPSVYNQPYFNVGEFPKNMPAIWDEHYGHLYKQGFNVVVGEFGGKFDAKDKPLQDALIDYLLANKEQNFFFWALNPNSGDTGGLLLDDWKTVNATKYNSLKKLLGQ
jgi:endoglucanase